MAEGPIETNVITKLEAIPLSADTATRRVTACISDIDNQLREIFQQYEAISLAIDESVSAQCAERTLCRNTLCRTLWFYDFLLINMGIRKV